jgi:hypothetical protein
MAGPRAFGTDNAIMAGPRAPGPIAPLWLALLSVAHPLLAVIQRSAATKDLSSFLPSAFRCHHVRARGATRTYFRPGAVILLALGRC